MAIAIHHSSIQPFIPSLSRYPKAPTAQQSKTHQQHNNPKAPLSPLRMPRIQRNAGYRIVEIYQDENYTLPESDAASTHGIYNAAHRLHTSVNSEKGSGV
jgi:hypothetical protein